ncbi:MAG: response regulator [Candidatus Hydrothermarchaeales archaeon]
MKKRVLIVDDDPHIIYSVKAGLEDIDPSFEVTGVSGGEECLELLKTERPDLILMDIMMSKIDGWDTTAKIKENEELNGIPIIFLTAKTDLLSKGMGMLTSEDYIEKPFDTVDLKNRIDTVLAK